MNSDLVMSVSDIQQRVRQLGKWFHNINLHGVQTAPEHFLGDYPSFKWRQFAHAIPADLSGKTVLDIGCNGGFYSLEMKRRGADRVVAIDMDEEYLAQARFAAEIMEMEIEFHNLSVYDVADFDERFDLVLFMGVLYHLRHPLLALDLIREYVADDLFVFQSLQRGSEEVFETKSNYPFSEVDIFEQPGFPNVLYRKEIFGRPNELVVSQSLLRRGDVAQFRFCYQVPPGG